ncbi:MAG TPA: hypothetical protein VJ983_08055 [candidate division Zixibacteria bacterium]|nr:hypothetical protein [candidate division Zixibacteria bacterium]
MPRAVGRYAVVLTALLLVGCGGGHSVRVGDEQSGVIESDVGVEAYLFDAQVQRGKKRNTFRLDVYQTDSILALTGRGYLGKGALKGWMTRDSVKVLFPSTNEYLYETIPGLIGAIDCLGEAPQVNLFSLFSALPDSVMTDPHVKIKSDYSDPDQPEFSVSYEGCPWMINATYDRQDAGWRITEFEFDDGHDNTLSGKRRIYKGDARVPSSRFRIAIPPSFVRIIP